MVNNRSKPNGYWNDWENLREELIKIIAKNNLDYVPSPKELKNLGCSYFLCAIYKHHRKFRDFKDKFERIEDHKKK